MAFGEGVKMEEEVDLVLSIPLQDFVVQTLTDRDSDYTAQLVEKLNLQGICDVKALLSTPRSTIEALHMSSFKLVEVSDTIKLHNSLTGHNPLLATRHPRSPRRSRSPRKGRRKGGGGDSGPSIRCRGGSIRYHHQDGRFEAVCSNPDHVRNGRHCRITRSSHESWGRDYAGRPLGTLMAWLSAGFDATRVQGFGDHNNPFLVGTLSLEERSSLREHLKSVPNGRALLDKERDRRPHEGEEPLEPCWA